MHEHLKKFLIKSYWHFKKKITFRPPLRQLFQVAKFATEANFVTCKVANFAT